MGSPRRHHSHAVLRLQRRRILTYIYTFRHRTDFRIRPRRPQDKKITISRRFVKRNFHLLYSHFYHPIYLVFILQGNLFLDRRDICRLTQLAISFLNFNKFWVPLCRLTFCTASLAPLRPVTIETSMSSSLGTWLSSQPFSPFCSIQTLTDPYGLISAGPFLNIWKPSQSWASSFFSTRR